MLTDMMKWHSGDHLHQKYQIKDNQNKDKLSVYRIQRKTKLGRKKLLGRGLDIAALYKPKTVYPGRSEWNALQQVEKFK